MTKRVLLALPEDPGLAWELYHADDFFRKAIDFIAEYEGDETEEVVEGGGLWSVHPALVGVTGHYIDPTEGVERIDAKEPDLPGVEGTYEEETALDFEPMEAERRVEEGETKTVFTPVGEEDDG